MIRRMLATYLQKIQVRRPPSMWTNVQISLAFPEVLFPAGPDCRDFRMVLCRPDLGVPMRRVPCLEGVIGGPTGPRLGVRGVRGVSSPEKSKCSPSSRSELDIFSQSSLVTSLRDEGGTCVSNKTWRSEARVGHAPVWEFDREKTSGAVDSSEKGVMLDKIAK